MVDKAVAELKAGLEAERYRGQLDEPWVFHDLRRSFKTGLSSLRVDSEVRDALLNHAKQGVDAHYDHAELDAEKQAAVETWERHITTCLNPPDKSNVTELRAASGKA
jgi:integrase